MIFDDWHVWDGQGKMVMFPVDTWNLGTDLGVIAGAL